MTLATPITERDARFSNVRKAMEAEGLSALVIAGHGSGFNRGFIRYFTDVHMWEGDGLLLIPLEGEPVQVQVTYASASMPDTLWVSDYRRAPDPQDEIVRAMKEKSLTHGKVGIGGLKKFITAGAIETLKSSLPNVDFVNADMMVNRIRAIKSELELQQLRDVWKMSQGAMDRFVEVIEPGMTQREAVAEAGKVIRAAGSFTDLSLLEEGKYSGLPRNVPLNCDDWVSFHLEVCGESGHWSELNVVCAFKEPSTLEQKLLDSEMRALDAVRARAKPGATLKDLEDTFIDVILEDGWELGEPAWHFSFHGQGMDGIEWPFYTPMNVGNEDTSLEAGMVFSYHPHRATIPAAGHPPKIFDAFVITKDGAKTLSTNWDFRWRIMK